MEEIISPISVRCPYVKIYLEDIEKIVDILNAEKPKEILLTANNRIFEFKEIDKLNTDKLSSLDINAYFSNDSDYEISFYKYGVHIYSHENTTKTQGITKKMALDHQTN